MLALTLHTGSPYGHVVLQPTGPNVDLAQEPQTATVGATGHVQLAVGQEAWAGLTLLPSIPAYTPASMSSGGYTALLLSVNSRFRRLAENLALTKSLASSC